MEIVLKDKAIADKAFWKKNGNKSIIKKIEELIDDILLHPEKGKGKPKKLKHELSSFWSRHINNEHRIIYKVVDDELHIVSLKGHYYDK
jgi:toxin YoeB